MKKYFGEGGVLAGRLKDYRFRPQQVDMADAIDSCLKTEGFLVCEAPTGVGKTFAYLIPAILSGLKVVVSTASKNLQEQIFYKDIPILKEVLEQDFKAVYMKGRGNYLCLQRLHRFLQEPLFSFSSEIELFEKVLEWTEVTGTGDRAEIEDMPDDCAFWNDICSVADLCLHRDCFHHNECFISRLRQEASDADILIVNHHLFFADLSIRSDYAQVLPRYEVVIFDEAHHLEDVATQFFGAAVSNFRVSRLAGDIRRELYEGGDGARQRVLRALNSLNSASRKYFDPWIDVGKRRLVADEIPDDLRVELCGSLKKVANLVKGLDEESQPVKALAGRAADLADEVDFISRAEEPDFIFWAEGTDRGGFLHASPLEVAGKLNELLYPKIKNAIFTSATLATTGNMTYLRSRLGLDSDLPVDELILSSPFDWKRQAALYIPRDMVPPDHEDFVACLCVEIKNILDISKGRAFILFTSYRNMEQAYSRLLNSLDYLILKQGQAPHQVLLKRFIQESPAVLLATASFWEGIDVRGDALCSVIIDKLPFAAPNEPIVAGRIENLKSRGMNPFMDYQVPMAILKLKQGLGRLIRSETDRGILAVLDNRILFRRYGNLFIDSLPPCLIATSLEELKDFPGLD